MATVYITETTFCDRPWFQLAKRTTDGAEKVVASGWRSRAEAEQALPMWQGFEDEPLEARDWFAGWGPLVHGERTAWHKPHQYWLTHALYIHGDGPLVGELRLGMRDGVRGLHHYVVGGSEADTSEHGLGVHCFLTEQPLVDAIYAETEERDAADPLIRADRLDRLPCDRRGYHRCDDCGIRVPLDQVGKSDLILGWCAQCRLDLHPQRSPFMAEAEMTRRQMESAAESRRLGDREG